MNYCKKCERCHDYGLRDDEDCPYYGEPCGCNHPLRGYSDETDVISHQTAALAPILRCDERSPTYHQDCAEAVRECQRIYYGEMVK